MKYFGIIKPLPANGKMNVDKTVKAEDVIAYLTALGYMMISDKPYRATLESFVTWGTDGLKEKYCRYRQNGEHEFNKIDYPECNFNDYFREIENKKPVEKPKADTLAGYQYEPLKYWLEYAGL